MNSAPKIAIKLNVRDLIFAGYAVTLNMSTGPKLVKLDLLDINELKSEYAYLLLGLYLRPTPPSIARTGFTRENNLVLLGMYTEKDFVPDSVIFTFQSLKERIDLEELAAIANLLGEG